MSKFTDVVRNQLIGYFNAGDQPTEAQFTELITKIQEGIEEHQHDSTGDGDGTGILNGPITMADDQWIGIGAALERIVFDAAGDICVMGALLGIGTITPDTKLHLHEASSAANYITITNDTTGQAGTDGFVIGIDGTEMAIIKNCENTDMLLLTNNITRVTIESYGYVKLHSVPSYADNTAALAGGLSAGHLYRTGDSLSIVH